MGRLTADPTYKVTKSQKGICTFVLAVNRPTEDKEADFFYCAAFGKIANTISKYFKKGNRILIEGSFRAEKYKQDGQDKTSWKVYINNFTWIDYIKKENGENYEDEAYEFDDF